jgi:cell shape-determining protein MreD
MSLIILQTSIIPLVPGLDHFYDLSCLLVIYLGLFREAREGIIVMLVIGTIVDKLSGGPFGFFLTCYVWLYILVRWMKTFLHVNATIILPLIVALAVFLENIVFLGLSALFGQGFRGSADLSGTVGVQMLWAMITGPILIALYRYAHNTWDVWCGKFMVRGSK